MGAGVLVKACSEVQLPSIYWASPAFTIPILCCTFHGRWSSARTCIFPVAKGDFGSPSDRGSFCLFLLGGQAGLFAAPTSLRFVAGMVEGRERDVSPGFSGLVSIRLPHMPALSMFSRTPKGPPCLRGLRLLPRSNKKVPKAPLSSKMTTGCGKCGDHWISKHINQLVSLDFQFSAARS